jgi:hypothetical protein
LTKLKQNYGHQVIQSSSLPSINWVFAKRKPPDYSKLFL